MESYVDVVLGYLAPTCDCHLLSLDHVVGFYSDGSYMIDAVKNKHPSSSGTSIWLFFKWNQVEGRC